MTTKTRNRIIIAGLAILLLIVVLLFTFLGGSSGSDKTIPDTVPVATGDLGISADIPVELPNPLEPLVEEENIDNGVTAAMQVADLFAERFGSYSNQGDYQNLRDLLPVMTDEYRSKTEVFLASVRDNPPATEYEGYTSTKVSTEELSYNEGTGRAAFELTMQQTKVAGASEPEISYPKLRIQLRLVGEDWRVHSAEWMK